jgi:hypothetical protein
LLVVATVMAATYSAAISISAVAAISTAAVSTLLDMVAVIVCVYIFATISANSACTACTVA